MLISCPACSARYEVPASLVAQGRELRCARCGTTWTLNDASLSSETDAEEDMPAVQDASPEETDAPASDTGDREAPAMHGEPQIRSFRMDEGLVWRSPESGRSVSGATRRVPVGSSGFWTGAWAASVMVMALGVWSLCHWRSEAMHVWPPSARLFTYFAPPARTA